MTKKNIAVLLAAVFFFLVSCSLKSEPSSLSIFYCNNKIYSIDESKNVNELFSVSSGTRNRALALVPGGYLIWDKSQSKLKLYNKKGKILTSEKFASGQVWIKNNLIFCNDFIYTSNEGFEYSAWSFKSDAFFHTLSLKKIWSDKIDCFNSDLLFEEDGKILLAGKSKEKEENNVYIINTKKSDSKAVKIFSYPKASGFTRLIHSLNKLVIFTSHADKSTADFIIYDADFSSAINVKEQISFSEYRLSLPDNISLSCMYGFGFPFENDIVIPFACGPENESEISLVRFSFQNDSWLFKSLTENCGGVNVYLTSDINNSGVWYLSHDVVKDSSLYGAAFYDGNVVSINYLK